jgi:uncharacterized membrane protein (DUF4010 family)
VDSLLLAIIVSAGLGAMIGLIRQWSDQTEKPGLESYLGVRTFTFWSVLGCVTAYLSEHHSPAVLPVVVAIIGGHFVWQVSGNVQTKGPTGSTTLAATLLTLLVGALVSWDLSKEAVLVSAVTIVLLGLKSPIHAWTRQFTGDDIRATLQFVAITGVILPLVPNEDLGPYNAINPFNVWMMVVLISGLGFFGYVMTRVLDARRGVLIASFFGGLASSTATTLAFSRQSRQQPALSIAYALAVTIACTVMLPRTLVLVAVINQPLALRLLGPFALMAAPAIFYAAWVRWRRRAEPRAEHPQPVDNPLQLSAAIKFALLYAAIVFVVKVSSAHGALESSLLPLSVLSGLTDMAAISLSVARNLDGTPEHFAALAAQAIVLAALSNTIVKAIIAAAAGSPLLRAHTLGVFTATCLTGGAAFWIAGL